MTAHVQEIIHSIEQLRDGDNHELVAELVRRNTVIDDLPLSDEQIR